MPFWTLWGGEAQKLEKQGIENACFREEENEPRRQWFMDSPTPLFLVRAPDPLSRPCLSTDAIEATAARTR